MAQQKSQAKPVPVLSGIREEIKQVTWPKRKEVVELTVTVITISLIVAAFVGIIDFSLANILGLIK